MPHRIPTSPVEPASVAPAGWKVFVRCRHCRLRYYTSIAEAVCPKCLCPANRPLPTPTLLLYGLLPPWGLVQAALRWSRTPLASLQAGGCSLVGALLWGLVYVIALKFGVHH